MSDGSRVGEAPAPAELLPEIALLRAEITRLRGMLGIQEDAPPHPPAAPTPGVPPGGLTLFEDEAPGLPRVGARGQRPALLVKFLPAVSGARNFTDRAGGSPWAPPTTPRQSTSTSPIAGGGPAIRHRVRGAAQGRPARGHSRIVGGSCESSRIPKLMPGTRVHSRHPLLISAPGQQRHPQVEHDLRSLRPAEHDHRERRIEVQAEDAVLPTRGRP